MTGTHTANLRTKVLDFGGLDSSRILISSDGIPSPTGNFPQTVSLEFLCMETGRKRVWSGRVSSWREPSVP